MGKTSLLVLCVTVALSSRIIDSKIHRKQYVSSYETEVKLDERHSYTARLEDYPFVAQVLLKTTRYTKVLCSATLVSNIHVVAPASCVTSEYEDYSSNLHVSFGSDRYNVKGEVYKVSQVHIHDHFSINSVPSLSRYNIAVLELDRTVKTSSTIYPVKLATSEHWSKLLTVKKETAVFDSLAWSSQRTSVEKLGKVEYSLVDPGYCTLDVDSEETSDDSFCTFSKRGTSCSHGFGLPILLKGVMYGMTTETAECSQRAGYELFINTTSSFVEEIVYKKSTYEITNSGERQWSESTSYIKKTYQSDYDLTKSGINIIDISHLGRSRNLLGGNINLLI